MHIPLIAFATALFGFADPTTTDILIIISSLIIGCIITHSFLDFIPSVFLGAPEGDTALSVLPGHRMMLKGRGLEAVKCSAIGSLGATFVALGLMMPVRLIMGSPIFTYEKLWSFVPFILLTIVSILILSERGDSSKAKTRPDEYTLRCRDSDGMSCINEENTSDIPAEGIRIKDVPNHLGEKVLVSGEITMTADKKRIFVADGDGIILVTLDRPSGIPIGEKVKVYGMVEGRLSFKSHLKQKGWALFLFVLTGFLGLILLGSRGITTYNWYPFPSLNAGSGAVILFPLFTGLFGLSGLLLSIMNNPDIPKQKTENIKTGLEEWRKVRGCFSGTIAGGLVGWYPGVTSAQATSLAKLLSGGENDDSEEMKDAKEFILSVSGVNTSNAIFNIVALFVILKARSGALHAVQDIAGEVIIRWEPFGNISHVMALMLISVLVSALVSFKLVMFFGRRFARACNRISYPKLVISVIIFLLIMIFAFSGIFGIVIVLISMCIGLIPPTVGVSRVHMMGSLMLPIILFLFGLDGVVLGFLGVG